MIAFEKYLIDNGYEVSHRVLKNKKYITVNEYAYVNLGGVFYNSYTKGNRRFTIGFGVVGTPVHITYPEIFLQNQISFGTNNLVHSKSVRGVDIIKLLSNYTNEDIENLFYGEHCLLGADRIPKPEII